MPHRWLLADPPSPAGRGDHHFGGLVLVLTQEGSDVAEQLDPERPVAVGRVGQPLAGDAVEECGIEHHPGPSEPVGGLVNAQPTAGDHEVGRVVQEGLDHRGHLGGIVLAVGIQGDHVAGPVRLGQPVAEFERGTLAQVDREHTGHHPGVQGHLGGAVRTAVHHHQGGHLEVTDQGGHGLQHVPDVLLFLVGGDEGHHRAEPGVRVPLLEIGPGPLHHESGHLATSPGVPAVGKGEPSVPLCRRHQMI